MRTSAWLVGALLLLIGCPADPPSKPPESPPPPPEERTAERILDQVVRARCVDPEEPWALAHGILVLGKDLPGPDGVSAVDHLVLDNVLADRLAFPKGKPGKPVEPHPGMFTKTLLEVGVDPGRRFSKGGRSFTLRELVDAQAAAYQPSAELPFHNEAWMLEVAAAADRPEVPALAQQTLEVLAKNQAYFARYQDGSKTYSKPFTQRDGKREPAEIHRYYCGGLHLFGAVQRLHGAELPAKLAEQYATLYQRMHLETQYWDRALKQVEGRFKGAELRHHLRTILAQKLKLQGHVLETLLRAVAAGALKLSKDDDARIAEGFAALEVTVRRLDAEGIYGELDAVRAAQPQLYLDLVGDSAHALHAYRLRK